MASLPSSERTPLIDYHREHTSNRNHRFPSSFPHASGDLRSHSSNGDAKPSVQHRSLPESEDHTTPQETRFPKGQIAILLFIQLAEPLQHSVILPFVNQLVLESGITNGNIVRVGYWAGLIVRLFAIFFFDITRGLIHYSMVHLLFQESLFFFTETLTIYHWGALSDRIGRKPVLAIGSMGVTISMLLFGLSNKSFWLLVASRALSGVLNGNIGVAKATMADLCDLKSLMKASSWIGVVWESGNALG